MSRDLTWPLCHLSFWIWTLFLSFPGFLLWIIPSGRSVYCAW